jgi:ABC-type amino acid transport substrate-binding protein
MSDDRFDEILRDGPPDEPLYRPRLTVSMLREAAATSHGTRLTLRAVAQLAVAAVAVVLVVGFVLLRNGGPQPGASNAPLLDTVRAEGVLRIAIRPDRPQTTTPSGAVAGFDVDVAAEVARRLGLRAELSYLPATQILGGSGTWAVGLPSSAVAPDTFPTSAPYYSWPVALVIGPSSTATSPADLDGTTICVVTGSAGEAWLAGTFPPAASTTAVLAPPRPTTIHRRNTDADCADEVSGGLAAAFLTDAWTSVDLAARPALRPLGGPVVTEARPFIAQRGPHDPATLIAEINRVLAEMRSDGTLTSLSQSRFGGLDLTQPAP